MDNLLISNPLVGADIEVFLRNKETREIVSAEGLIPGTKYEPHQFDESDPFYCISLDNVSAEFCIPPAHNVDEWLNGINRSLNYIMKTIPENLAVAALPSAHLSKVYLNTPNAKTFGCEPDFNAWLRKTNRPPKPKDKTLRSCGGHIHVGYDKPTDALSEMIIKVMDLFIGVPSVLQEPDNERKNLYGKAGAFRFKPYGVEYRTVSNYYLATKELLEWAYNNTMEAVNFINNKRTEEIDAVAELIQAAINNADKVIAGNLIRQFDIQLV